MHAQAIFGVCLLANVLISFRSSPLWAKFVGSSSNQDDTDKVDAQEKERHRALLKKYLIVYLLATLGDWLQGPYVYALYSSYGYQQHDNAILFVGGFGSSMVFGSFIGGMADWGGRKRFVVLYAILYALSCVTKHFKNFHMLMLGRLLGGVCTSLLFSVFEAWLIRAHADNKVGKSLLGASFSAAAYGNSIVAILAGLMANKVATFKDLTPVVGSFHVGGYIGPFDLSMVVLVICGICATLLWEENYGDTSNADGETDPRADKWYAGLKNAYITTVRSRDILLCGIVSSLFEGSMYVFVFMWTPLLGNLKEDENEELPFGLIFSTFMVCCMAGSSLFSVLISKIQGEKLGVGIFAVGAVAMAIASVAPSDSIAFSAINLFEVCVGMYFPIMGTMKGAIVPEDKRAAIYNLYRIPLNCIVLFCLLTDMAPKTAFRLNACMLTVATGLQFMLMNSRLSVPRSFKKEKPDEEETIALTSTSGAEEKV
eukprot:CAMPEP_0195282424 /NCGR_PEP_ID=MMETSP0707-20130614/1299_1 /TAXON_ID=33640 /ORGANISM="Asterionellopsis glacialis, Strain CCMP134" /LENGTH=483 /DNA_ID=CAMNT_0040341391 /DNA_START=69 /DNA_END=1520 /DNA_ORIENTATION=-